MIDFAEYTDEIIIGLRSHVNVELNFEIMETLSMTRFVKQTNLIKEFTSVHVNYVRAVLAELRKIKNLGFRIGYFVNSEAGNS